MPEKLLSNVRVVDLAGRGNAGSPPVAMVDVRAGAALEGRLPACTELRVGPDA